MSLPVILSPDASRDFDAAAGWYEEEAGQGTRFIEHLQAAFDRIGRSPEMYATVFRDLRRVRVRRYPYQVYYRVFSDRVEVLAIVHANRDPSVWRSRA